MLANSRLYALLFSVVSVVFLVGNSYAQQVVPESTTVSSSEGTTVSFSMDIQPIFDNRCIRCHNPTLLRGGMDLTADNSYANLVNVPTSAPCMAQVPDSVRVVPGCVLSSMLWLKTRPDDARCLGPMPFGTAGLGVIAPDEFALIEQWILEGAQNN